MEQLSVFLWKVLFRKTTERCCWDRLQSSVGLLDPSHSCSDRQTDRYLLCPPHSSPWSSYGRLQPGRWADPADTQPGPPSPTEPPGETPCSDLGEGERESEKWGGREIEKRRLLQLVERRAHNMVITMTTTTIIFTSAMAAYHACIMPVSSVLQGTFSLFEMNKMWWFIKIPLTNTGVLKTWPDGRDISAVLCVVFFLPTSSLSNSLGTAKEDVGTRYPHAFCCIHYLSSGVMMPNDITRFYPINHK